MINVGIIGLGRSGWELHATPLQDMDDYRVVAVCAPNAVRLAQAAETFSARPYGRAEALIEAPDVHLVVVATPNDSHASLAIAALEAGKHVVVEKPMAPTLAEASEMVITADRVGRTLTVFHNRRWDRDYQTIKAMVEQGVLGELLTVGSRVMTYGPEWPNYGVSASAPQWRMRAAHGGGFLADWGPHLVDQCLDLTGEWPASLSCQLRSDLWATEVEDFFSLRLSFPSGLLATLEASNNARMPLPRWFIVGREGTLIAEGEWGRWTEMRIRRTIAGVPTDLVPQAIGPSSGGRNYDVGEGLSELFYGDLAEALSAGRAPAITARRARDVMAILEAARLSNATGQVVALDPPEGSPGIR